MGLRKSCLLSPSTSLSCKEGPAGLESSTALGNGAKKASPGRGI
jgi:hypothetical protein